MFKYYNIIVVLGWINIKTSLRLRFLDGKQRASEDLFLLE